MLSITVSSSVSSNGGLKRTPVRQYWTSESAYRAAITLYAVQGVAHFLVGNGEATRNPVPRRAPAYTIRETQQLPLTRAKMPAVERVLRLVGTEDPQKGQSDSPANTESYGTHLHGPTGSD
jgi:hypothetical protein